MKDSSMTGTSDAAKASAKGWSGYCIRSMRGKHNRHS